MTCNRRLDYQSNNALCSFCLPADVALKSTRLLSLSRTRHRTLLVVSTPSTRISSLHCSQSQHAFHIDPVTHHPTWRFCLAMLAAAEAMDCSRGFVHFNADLAEYYLGRCTARGVNVIMMFVLRDHNVHASGRKWRYALARGQYTTKYEYLLFPFNLFLVRLNHTCI